MSSFILIYAILYDVTARNRNNGLFPTVEVSRGTYLRHFQLRNISRTGISVIIKILVDNYASRKSYVTISVSAVTGIKHDFSVEHHKSKRLTNTLCRITGIPRKATVHNANNFTIHILVYPVSLIKHCGSLIFRSIHFVICRNYANVGIVYVSCHNMNNLTVITRIIIQNNFRFLDTGSIIPISFCDEIIILICARRSIVIIINTCSKGCKWHSCKYSSYHYKHKQKRHTFLKCLFHFLTPFFIFSSITFIPFNEDLEAFLH